MRRKPNPDQRRRELCQAAIQLLADDGVKGVSHLKVDRKAAVPSGTTSFYFRTRSALVYAVAAYVAELERKELATAAKDNQIPGGPSGLATLVIRSGTGVRLTRIRARYALELQAGHDRELDEILAPNREILFDLIRNTVIALQPTGADTDPALVDVQANVIVKFIGGLMLGFASGDRKIATVEQLDELISGIVAGIAATHGRHFSRSS